MKKDPLIRLTKRANMSKGSIWMIRLGALVFALLLGSLIFLIVGTNPATAYGAMLSSSLGKASGIRQVVKNAVPLLGTALALAPCFAM